MGRSEILPGLSENIVSPRLNIRAEVEGLVSCLALVRASFGAALLSNRLPPLINQENLVVMPLPFFGSRGCSSSSAGPKRQAQPPVP